MAPKKASSRFHALDLLRGLFIVIIIIDHLSRWPSLFSFITGKAMLWVTAAEGFVIISGLLVGYIRGFKSKAKSLKEVSYSLLRRALTLYLWAIIGSIVYTAAIWYIPLVGGAPGLPIEKGDWFSLVYQSVTLNYTFLWVYFLKLYAIFLALSPLALWMLRRGQAPLLALISFTTLLLGWFFHNEILQWQFVFFIPVIAGYYMPSIQKWWQSRRKSNRRVFAASVVLATILTIILSTISTFLPEVSSTLDRVTTNAFSKDSISLLRALMAFLWFTGYLFVFIYFEKYIERWFGWLLRPIGTHSLTAYIVHGAVVIGISFLFVGSDNVLYNTLLGALAILTVWAIVKIPGINRVIPR